MERVRRLRRLRRYLGLRRHRHRRGRDKDRLVVVRLWGRLCCQGHPDLGNLRNMLKYSHNQLECGVAALPRQHRI